MEVFSEVDEEMLKKSMERIRNEMGIMEGRIMQALKVKGDEIYLQIDKKSHEVQQLRNSINELT